MAAWGWISRRISGRARVWIAVGLLATAIVVLRDVGTLLAAVGGGSEGSFGPEVFTGPRFDPATLRTAVEHWHAVHFGVDGAPGTGSVLPLLSVHLLVDVVVLVPFLAYLLARLLSRAGAGPAVAVRMPWAYAIVDIVETLLTFAVLVVGGLEVTNIVLLGLMQALSVLKWLVLGVIAVILVLLWRVPDAGEDSFARAAGSVQESRAGGVQPAPLVLAGLIVLTAGFAVLVALPAGGPLEQIPDVLRYQLSGAPLPVFLVSMAALPLLAMAMTTAGLLATSPASVGGPGSADLSSRAVLGTAAAWGLVWVLVVAVVDRRVSPVPLAALVVVGVLWAALRIRRAVAAPAEASEPSALPLGLVRDDHHVAWVGGLAGAVLAAGGLGLVRAATVPWLLDDRLLSRWALPTLLGVTMAVAAGAVAQDGVRRLADVVDAWPRSRRIGAGGVVGGVVAVAAIVLALVPAEAWRVGTTGAVAVGFSWLALLVGVLAWLSRRWRRWPVTRDLGLGVRTPFLTLLVAVWITAGALDSAGGYHDARLLDAAPAAPQPLSAAVTAWVEAQEGCIPDEGPVPLVLVGAPGGGIRAAYWTAAVLDSLSAEGDCAGRRIFAVSGVSGGSVGAATWLRAVEIGTDGREAVGTMADDRALAAGVSALLTRDVVQPLVGVTRGWSDRAAQFEEGWAAGTPVFGSKEEPAAWSAAGRDLPWAPVLVLNSASVTDGCRILVTTLGGLPAGPDGGCQSPPGTGRAPAGPATAALDLGWVGAERKGTGDTATCDGGRDMRVTTAALLSARFPYVTPSGALRGCVDGAEHVAFAVDGGYFENSGLLSLVDLHAALLPEIERAPFPVEVWVVLADNHYRDSALAEEPRRPREFFAPLQALLARAQTVGPSALEQRLAYLVRDGDEARFVVIAPRPSAAVTAPLGWVLSATTQEGLDHQLDAQLARPEVRPFLEALRSTGS